MRPLNSISSPLSFCFYTCSTSCLTVLAFWKKWIIAMDRNGTRMEINAWTMCKNTHSLFWIILKWKREHGKGRELSVGRDARSMWERWEWREVWWHFNGSERAWLYFKTRCNSRSSQLLLPPPSPPLSYPRCFLVTGRVHLFELTAAVDTSLSPYWGSISSLIQPCWESVLQRKGGATQSLFCTYKKT